jgi:hypothetical protein
MPKNYVYRMDHDTGFAPHAEKDFCLLSGCKITTVEKYAKEGSWVIGIGGNNTGKPDKIIYAMEVKYALPLNDFKAMYPSCCEYYKHKEPGPNVLFSTHFVYFGNQAIELPKELKDVILRTQGYKCVSDEDIKKLEKHFNSKKTWGKIGEPNNPMPLGSRNKCNC